MATIHIHRQLSSDTLPELRPLIGKTVDIFVSEADGSTVLPDARDVAVWLAEAANPLSNPLAGSILRYEDPFGPAIPADEWEANQ